MGDEPHVGLVDPHPERDRRRHHHVLGGDERGLVALANVAVEPGVIGECLAAARSKLLGQFLGRVAAGGIDDPRPRLVLEQHFQLACDPVARSDVIADVGPVEAGDDHPVGGDPELDQYVLARAPVGGRGQSQARHRAMLVEQRQQQAIVGAEVMPPFGNAMRLVDREQGDLDFSEQAMEVAGRRPLGCDIEQVEFPAPQCFADATWIGAHTGQRRRSDPERIGAAHLVMHQRNQWRDDDPGAPPFKRGQLIAERLARPGRHHRQRMLSRHRPLDDNALHPAKGGETETLMEQRLEAHSPISSSSRSAACRAHSWE